MWKRKKNTFVPDQSYCGPSEEEAQMAYFQWVRYLNHPAKDCIFAIPNQVSQRATKGLLVKRARLGVKKGVSDIFIAYPMPGPDGFMWHGCFVELKVGSNKASPEQVQFLLRMRGLNYAGEVAHGLDELIGITKAYLGLK